MLAYTTIGYETANSWYDRILRKRYVHFCLGQLKPVVVLEKPLPTAVYNKLQTFWKFVKMVTKTNFIHGFDVTVRAKVNANDNTNEQLFDESMELDEVESFGVTLSSPKRSGMFCIVISYNVICLQALTKRIVRALW